MSDLQLQLYELYVNQCLKDCSFKGRFDEQRGNGRLLEYISSLRKIVNHPHIFFQFFYKHIAKEKLLTQDGNIRQINLNGI